MIKEISSSNLSNLYQEETERFESSPRLLKNKSFLNEEYDSLMKN